MKISNEVRKQIKKLRDKIEDKEFFLSEPYHRTMLMLVQVLGQKDDVKLNIDYNESPEASIAYTNGRRVYVNAANPLTSGIPGRGGKVESLEGFAAHECGHICCTDFNRRSKYLKGFGRGLIYPWPPAVKTAAEKKAWRTMKALVKRQDPVAVSVLTETASHITNILEDVFIESVMCTEYPGSVCTSIQKNAARIIAGIPSEEERKNKDSDGLTIMMDMIFRYARAGKTKEEAVYSRCYAACLDECRRAIDEAVQSPDQDIRYTACNILMVKIWGYLKKEIEDVRTALKEEIDKLSDEELKNMLDQYLKERISWIILSETDSDCSEGVLPEGWDGNLDGEAPEKETEPEGHAENDSFERFREEQAGLQEGKESECSQDEWNLSDRTESMSNEIAEENYKKNKEKQLKKELEKQAEDMQLGKIHKGCKFEVHRSTAVSSETQRKYKEIEPEINHITRSLQLAVDEVLKRQEDGSLSGLYMGKRLSKGSLYRRDGKLFEKKLIPEEELSIAVAMLVDTSYSMSEYERIDYAIKACQSIYKFCQLLSIPVMVYGHCADRNPMDSNDTVKICACADFDSVDGNDYLRIMELEPDGFNRDGAAISFTGERLATRTEDIKILLLLSDGDPHATGYKGETAKKDIQGVVKNLKKKGVTLFAAAIGNDKAQIEEIYQKGFLSISDLKTMPVKFARLLMQYT